MKPLKVIEPATDPAKPVRPNRVLLTLLGTGVGLLLGLSFALLVDWLDDTIGDPDDVERHVGAPVLGTIVTLSAAEAGAGGGPHRRRAASVARGGGVPRRADGGRVRGRAGDGTGGRVLLVSSCSPREGKTTVASNLASVLAQDGKRTLLVDADLRRPRVHQVLGLDGRRGLSNVIVGRATLEDAVSATRPGEPLGAPARGDPAEPRRAPGPAGRRRAARTPPQGVRPHRDRLAPRRRRHRRGGPRPARRPRPHGGRRREDEEALRGARRGGAARRRRRPRGGRDEPGRARHAGGSTAATTTARRARTTRPEPTAAIATTTAAPRRGRDDRGAALRVAAPEAGRRDRRRRRLARDLDPRRARARRAGSRSAGPKGRRSAARLLPLDASVAAADPERGPGAGLRCGLATASSSRTSRRRGSSPTSRRRGG